ncbi:RNA-binding protein [Metabacillus sp. GX 13764]|uniref:YlmH family RNA-binding protein n=1 Tax=Metabacillus kandeliae TaxID=2900151 RepID=UPI001E4B9EB8|nr:RNA-binding protein [Metabacillus kandeliae]MCD7033873.1 RNA-binding protein [Metabacillus kandeliae]
MEHLFQHFREEERIFIEKAAGWKEQAENNYSPKLTDFLDPREQEIAEAVVGNTGEIKIAFYGGHPLTERKRALIYPEYFSPLPEDFSLSLFSLQYPEKFVTVEHRQVLGSLLSIGLARAKFGDILFLDQQVQIVAAEEYEPFLTMNFHHVGKATVSLEKISFSDIIEPRQEISEASATVSSLRLDAVGAAIYNLSRQKMQSLITGGAVKVNFRQVEQASFECREGDMLSVRGHGRSKLLSVDGKTKKDKIKIRAGKQK